MNERQRLVEELVDLPIVGKTNKGGKALGFYLKAEDIITIVDYIIADRLLVFEPLLKFNNQEPVSQRKMNEPLDSSVQNFDPDLKAFVGTKILLAKPMTETQYLKQKGVDITNRETQGDGYLVFYDNDYCSWSPKDVFETHYRLLTDSEKFVVRR